MTYIYCFSIKVSGLMKKPQNLCQPFTIPRDLCCQNIITTCHVLRCSCFVPLGMWGVNLRLTHPFNPQFKDSSYQAHFAAVSKNVILLLLVHMTIKHSLSQRQQFPSSSSISRRLESNTQPTGFIIILEETFLPLLFF